MKKKLHNPVIQLQWDYLQLQTTKKKLAFMNAQGCMYANMAECLKLIDRC